MRPPDLARSATTAPHLPDHVAEVRCGRQIRHHRTRTSSDTTTRRPPVYLAPSRRLIGVSSRRPSLGRRPASSACLRASGWRSGHHLARSGGRRTRSGRRSRRACQCGCQIRLDLLPLHQIRPDQVVEVRCGRQIRHHRTRASSGTTTRRPPVHLASSRRLIGVPSRLPSLGRRQASSACLRASGWRSGRHLAISGGRRTTCSPMQRPPFTSRSPMQLPPFTAAAPRQAEAPRVATDEHCFQVPADQRPSSRAPPRDRPRLHRRPTTLPSCPKSFCQRRRGAPVINRSGLAARIFAGARRTHFFWLIFLADLQFPDGHRTVGK